MDTVGVERGVTRTCTSGVGSGEVALETMTNLYCPSLHFSIKFLSGAWNVFLPMSYTFFLEGNTRLIGYFLGDDIYPEWPIFVRPIHDDPAGPQTAYTKAQERVRMHIERLLGVVQGRFVIIRRES